MARLAARIRSWAREGDQLYVWGTRQQVYALAGLRSPVRYIYDAPFRNRAAARRFFGEDIFERIVERLRMSRCRFVMITDVRALKGFDALRDLLRSEYHLATEIEGPLFTTRLYCIKNQPIAERRRQPSA